MHAKYKNKDLKSYKLQGQETMSTNAGTICVVEDNHPIRKLICTVLKKSGYETIDFAEGIPARDWLEKNKPDLIILDILLPDYNGEELQREIRSSMPWGKDIPIIAVTGFAKMNDRNKYISAGFDEYIAKPINTATFTDQVKSLLK